MRKSGVRLLVFTIAICTTVSMLTLEVVQKRAAEKAAEQSRLEKIKIRMERDAEFEKRYAAAATKREANEKRLLDEIAEEQRLKKLNEKPSARIMSTRQSSGDYPIYSNSMNYRSICSFSQMESYLANRNNSAACEHVLNRTGGVGGGTKYFDEIIMRAYNSGR